MSQRIRKGRYTGKVKKDTKDKEREIRCEG